MQNKRLILVLLKNLQELYDDPINSSQKDFYSKLALLELCGWLEQFQDEIVNDYSNKRIKEPKNLKEIEEKVIGKTYGFNYDNHFRPMIINLIGYRRIEILENKMKQKGIFQMLTDQLSSLWGVRRRAAHTSFIGATINYQSPSIMINYLESLYPILVCLRQELLKL